MNLHGTLADDSRVSLSFTNPLCAFYDAWGMAERMTASEEIMGTRFGDRCRKQKEPKTVDSAHTFLPPKNKAGGSQPATPSLRSPQPRRCFNPPPASITFAISHANKNLTTLTAHRLNFGRSPPSITNRRAQPEKNNQIPGFFSDLLFQPHHCASTTIRPEWVSRSTVDRKAGLSPADFRRLYEEPNKPVVLTDAARR